MPPPPKPNKKPEIISIRPKQAAGASESGKSLSQPDVSPSQPPAAPQPTLEASQPVESLPRKPLGPADIARRIEIRLWRKPELPEFSLGLTMPELAKRWRVASHKIGQRRSTPKFQKWSHRCDPDGIIWEYRPASQQNIPQFFPVGKAPKEPPAQPKRAKSGKPKPGRSKPSPSKPASVPAASPPL